MKCISVCQPWAWAIIHGPKRIENRTWSTNHRGPLLIHASITNREYLLIEKIWQQQYRIPLPPWSEMARGVIIGQVTLVDCVPIEEITSPDPWAEGPICWYLADPIAFTNPIPYRGKLSIYEVEDALLRS